MSKVFRKLQLSPQANRIISYIFYALFALLIIYNIVNTNKTSYKIMYLILLIVILGFALYSEFLKHLYEKAIKQLAYDCNPKQATQTFDFLMTKDFAHAYRNSRILFDTLCAMDELNIETTKRLLATNDKFFHSTLDQLLIYHYSQFFIAFLSNDEATGKIEYQKIIRMKESKVKGMKVSPLFNWDQLDGMYQFMRQDIKQSINLLKKVDTTYMNPREMVQYHAICVGIGTKAKDISFTQSHLKQLNQINGTSLIATKGINL